MVSGIGEWLFATGGGQLKLNLDPILTQPQPDPNQLNSTLNPTSTRRAFPLPPLLRLFPVNISLSVEGRPA